MHRTFTCGELTAKHLKKKVVLEGWVANRRDHGSLTFIDLRDRYGITQVVFNPKNKQSFEQAKELGKEFVVRVEGIVSKRPKGTENEKISTGSIEVNAEKLEVLNKAAALPLEVEGRVLAGEDTRLKYRYLDLRRKEMHEKIILRHKVVKTIREYFDKQGFLEIETPFLAKSTPEGARDFLVPSRQHSGKFFALPQSPQLFKQMLMVAGFDKYFQIVRCMRDEDLRADRQPEFTQLDVEMSFPEEQDVQNTIEECMQFVFQKVFNEKLKLPFPKLSHEQAMQLYGSDKPDLRFEMKIQDITKFFKETSFEIFKQAIASGGRIKAIIAEKATSFSKKEIEELQEIAKIYKAKGIITAKVLSTSKVETSIEKFLSLETMEELIKKTKAKKDSLIIMIADKEETIALTALGQVRLHLGKKLGLIDEKRNEFLWVVDFPLFEWGEEEQKIVSTHHPFTHPKEEDIEKMEKEPLKVKAKAYDLVWNGVELGGGSIRIHEPDIQAKVFKILGLSEKETMEKFGFMLEAFQYGTPPHGGIALGLDRMIMLMAKAESIREVIAFPKNKACLALMENAPSQVSEKQLKELKLKLDVENNGKTAKFEK